MDPPLPQQVLILTTKARKNKLEKDDDEDRGRKEKLRKNETSLVPGDCIKGLY
jgi:hypothetical protein